MQRLVSVPFVAAGLLWGVTAHAGNPVACGSSPGATNIPNGAIFLSSGTGPIKSTLAAVGETRSHSGISHGNGWYTHSTMFEPHMRAWDDSETSCGLITGDYCCQGPLKGYELQNGYPGSSQIDGGALYTFYYNPNDGVAPDFIYYQRSLDANGVVDTRGASVANWLWMKSNYAWVASRQDSSRGFYRVGFTGVTPYAQYSLYQYRDYQNINTGTVPWNYGDVCSTTVAYAQQQAGLGVISNTRSHNGVAGVPNSYDHSYVVSGINALYNATYQDCSSSGSFIQSVGSFLTCTGESDLCDDAARQVSNCMADGIGGHCYDDSNRYTQIRDNVNPGGPVDGSGYAISRSVSPDNLGGWGGWGYGTSTASVWSTDGNQAVNFNAPGATYACFF